MELYPKGIENGDDTFMSVFLHNETVSEFRARFQFSILDINNTITNSYSSVQGFGEKTIGYDDDDNDNVKGYFKFFNLESLKNKSSLLLPNNNLTIVCDLTIFGPERNTEPVFDLLEEENKEVKKLRPLIQDLEKLFSDKDMCDVQILCGGQVFDCHQVILSARSPVFRIMFQADMAEKMTRKVNVTDVEPDVMAELLTFIYSGNIPKLDKLDKERVVKTQTFDLFAQGLLMAAEKYQLEQLKNICLEKLCCNLDAKNCLNYLILGDLYQARNLRKAALQFITSNMENVFKSKDWKERLKDYPNLMAEVIEEIAGGGYDMCNDM